MNKVIEKGAPTRMVSGPDGKLVKVDARRNVIGFTRIDTPDGPVVVPVPFQCEVCAQGALYGEDGKWFCGEHWYERKRG